MLTNGRVKGYLNITRAFGAGFLKQVTRWIMLNSLHCYASFELLFHCYIDLYPMLMIFNFVVPTFPIEDVFGV